MSVNPGFGGQSFIPAMLEKARLIKQRIDESGHAIRLEIDGGIKVDNIATVAATGVDAFVIGSGLFANKDYAATIQKIRQSLVNI
jgi:ribulose-phosphate 3-epimerase